MKRLWPFPGDVPVIRARKVALAYRAEATRQRELVTRMRDMFDKIDLRLIEYSEPGATTAINNILKDIPNSDPVAALDQRFTDWGETFHSSQPIQYGMDDWVKGSEAAKLIHTNSKTMSNKRIEGAIKGLWDPQLGTNGGYLYKVRDVYALRETMYKGRRWLNKRTPDTLNDSGRSDGECATTRTSQATTGPKTSGTPPTPPSKNGSKTRPPSQALSSSKPSPDTTGPGSD